MLDIKFIREHQDEVQKAITDKHLSFDLATLIEVDEQRRKLMAETETLQATKNAFSKEIGKLSPEDRQVKLLEMKEVDSRQEELKGTLKELEERYALLMLQVPNIPSQDAPIGKDDSENVPASYWSPALGYVDPADSKVSEVPTKFDFEPKDHVALGTALDLFDLEAGTKTSGFRGYYLKNELVLLAQALFWHVEKKLRAKGFTLMIPPILVREFALLGSGHFPAGRDEVFRIGNPGTINTEEEAQKESLYLAGTSEPSLLAYYSDRILDEKELPIKVCGYSACYRSEVGSYGKDAKGLYRVKEFMKVEQVIICKADMAEGDEWLEKLRGISEEILQELKLPYRVLNICTGDMGAGKFRQYDIETWMPGRGNYGETHSDSNLTDWQARRLNIRYRDAEGKIHHAYTLNNTAVATPRILIAILENYQQADGSIKVPDVLIDLLGFDTIKR